jgi:hypothetical protein
MAKGVDWRKGSFFVIRCHACVEIHAISRCDILFKFSLSIILPHSNCYQFLLLHCSILRDVCLGFNVVPMVKQYLKCVLGVVSTLSAWRLLGSIAKCSMSTSTTKEYFGEAG